MIEVFLGFSLCLMGQLMCGYFHEVRKLVVGIGGKRGEIVAPAHRSRDFDLFAPRARALAAIRAERLQ